MQNKKNKMINASRRISKSIRRLTYCPYPRIYHFLFCVLDLLRAYTVFCGKKITFTMQPKHQAPKHFQNAFKKQALVGKKHQLYAPESPSSWPSTYYYHITHYFYLSCHKHLRNTDNGSWF